MKFTDNKNLQDRKGTTKRSKSKFDLLKKTDQDNSKSKAIEAFCVGPDVMGLPIVVSNDSPVESFFEIQFDNKNLFAVKKHSYHIYHNLLKEIPEDAQENITAYPYENFEKYFQRAKLLVPQHISNDSFRAMFRQHWYECQDIVLHLDNGIRYFGTPKQDSYSLYSRRVKDFKRINAKLAVPKQHKLTGITLDEYINKYEISTTKPVHYFKPWTDLGFSYDAVKTANDYEPILDLSGLADFEESKILEIPKDCAIQETDDCDIEALIRSWGEDNDDVDTLEVLEDFVADTAPQEQQEQQKATEATEAKEAKEATEVIEESPVEAKQPRFDFDILRNTFIRFVFIPAIVSLMFSFYWRGIAESTDTVMRVFNSSAVLFILCAGFYASVSCIKSVSKQDRLSVAKASVKSFRVFYDVLFSSYLFLVLIASRLFHNDLNLHSAFNNFALLLLVGVVGVFVFHKELRNYLVEEEALIKSKI